MKQPAFISIKHKKPVRRAFWIILIAGLLIGIVSFVALFVLRQSFRRELEARGHLVVVPSAPKPISVSSKMLFAGTTFWGRYINDWSMASELKYAYPFSRLHEFGRENYDAWIAGLECPTSPRIHMTSAQMEANLQFNCRPEYLPEAAKWFTIFGLSNNHTDNQGELGFSETKAELDKVGIQYFGHYDPEKLDDVCEVVAMPAKVKMSNGKATDGRLPIALCGYHGFIKNPSKQSRAVVKEYAKYFPTIALPHSGVEYKPSPDAIKTDLYRELIDNGADAVLGDHPHWVQTSEAYKGRLIVYSMGNFLFDQQRPPEMTRSAAIVLELESDKMTSNDLKQWLELGKTCEKFKDDCLAKVRTWNLSKPVYKFTFGVVGTDDSNKILKPATAAQTASILERLKWSQTVQGLQAPYFGR